MVVGTRGLAPATAEAFLMVLGNAEYRVVAEVQALERGVPCDQKLDSGDHARMCDEIEEAGNVLLIEDENSAVVAKHDEEVEERQRVM